MRHISPNFRFRGIRNVWKVRLCQSVPRKQYQFGFGLGVTQLLLWLSGNPAYEQLRIDIGEWNFGNETDFHTDSDLNP